jgi:hypothetical protein
VVVLEKCLAVGLGGIVSDGVRKSLSGIHLNGYTVIAGLGPCTASAAWLRLLLKRAYHSQRSIRMPVVELPLMPESLGVLPS